MADRGSEDCAPTFASLTAGAPPDRRATLWQEIARVKRSLRMHGVAGGVCSAALFAWGCTGDIGNAWQRETGSGGTGSGETGGSRGTGETGGSRGTGDAAGSGGSGGSIGADGSSRGQGGSFVPGQPAPPVFSCDP